VELAIVRNAGSNGVRGICASALPPRCTSGFQAACCRVCMRIVWFATRPPLMKPAHRACRSSALCCRRAVAVSSREPCRPREPRQIDRGPHRRSNAASSLDFGCSE